MAGEHVKVWDELVTIGEGVRREPTYADAVAVAAETMRRARHNVETLIERLVEMGYRFIPPEEDAQLESLIQREQRRQANGALGPEERSALDSSIYKTHERKPLSPEGQAAMDQLRASLSPEARAVLDVAQSKPSCGIWADPDKRAAGRARRDTMLSEHKTQLEAKIAARLKEPPLLNPEVFDPPNKQTATQIKKLEKAAGGPIPISLRAWYEQVGGVSLNGSHEVINPRGHETAADPLVVSPLRALLEMLDMEKGEDDEISLWIAPDDLHKANVSGGDPYMIRIPNGGADAALEYEWHNTTFVDYLRNTFEWGGFPGWERDKKAPREAIATLAEGLLPL